MTIAACYISADGVVLGADSTSTYAGQSGQQYYYNHGQKLFELSNEPEHGTHRQAADGEAIHPQPGRANN